MSFDKHALPIPDQILEGELNEHVTELARIWWGAEQPQMILRPAVRDPALMGAILAELSWHFAHAYAAKDPVDPEAVLKDIRNGWEKAHARAKAARTGGSA